MSFHILIVVLHFCVKFELGIMCLLNSVFFFELSIARLFLHVIICLTISIWYCVELSKLWFNIAFWGCNFVVVIFFCVID
jgi:hypothetical protein